MIIGTWNLENLYLPGGDYGPPTQAAYDAKLDALAAGVQATEADVLGVQEVGDPDALGDLLGRLGDDWRMVLSSYPDDRGIRVGFIATTDLDVVLDEADFLADLEPIQANDIGGVYTAMGRGALGVRVTGAVGSPPVDAEITVIACHLKSKLLSYPDGRFTPYDEDERARYGAYALYRRAAEAATVRSFATAMMDGDGREQRVIVLGDLNDLPSAATTQLLVGPTGSELGTNGAFIPDKGDQWRLWNLAPFLPEGSYTRIFEGRGELIDHIFVSRALLRPDLEPHVVGIDEIRSITPIPTLVPPAFGSDHAALVVAV